MKEKKNQESNLEKKRSSFLIGGLIFACSLSLCSFEWANFSYEDYHNPLAYEGDFLVPEEIQQTFTVNPPKPKPKKKVKSLILEIVDDNEDLTEEIEMDIDDLDEEEDIEVEDIGLEEEDPEEGKIFIIVEDQPEFPGGEKALKQFLADNITYPQLALEAGIRGKVFVTFVVGKDGSVEDAKVLRGIGGGCEKEALKAIEKMPKWKPGKQRGKAVNVQYNIPVVFNY